MNHTLSHRVAGYECALCWFSWSLEFTNWWRRLDLIRDMCCSGLNASEKHSEREKERERESGRRRGRGGRMDGAWALCCFSSACPSGHCLTLGLVGLERRGREKINLTSTLRQETRDSQRVSWPSPLNYHYSSVLVWHPSELNTKQTKQILLWP